MSGRNRRTIAAAIGLTLLLSALLAVGAERLDSYEAYHPRADRPAQSTPNSVSDTARIANAVEAIRDDQQSADAGEREARDLSANESQARWARWSAWSAVVQFVVSSVGLGALIYTLGQTDKSLRVARRANIIAQSGMRRQLRPHLYVTGVTAKLLFKSENMPAPRYLIEARLHIKCFGATPAKRAVLYARCFVGGIWNAPFETDLSEAVPVPLADVPPGNEPVRTPPCSEWLTPEDTQHVKAAGMTIFVEGRLEYTDAFGKHYLTRFRQSCAGDDYATLTFWPCPEGNDAD